MTTTDTSGTATYDWDFANRLTRVSLPGGAQVIFKYDPFGRRIQKSSTSRTTVYVYDGANVIEEVDSSGAVLARYTQGSEIDEPLAMLRSGATSYYEADGLGSITSLTGSSGLVAASYTYDSFGNLTASMGTLDNPFRYTAREFDTEVGITYYRARYYDPTVGRFASEDAARFQGGPDFYVYVGNKPTNYTDPFGLYTKEPNVPPLNPRLDQFMRCMDNCTGREQHVTATTNGKHLDPGHAGGSSVDLRPIGTPSRNIFCCAGRCGARYLLDERTLRTTYGVGPHYHIQLVPPLHPSPKAPNSIPPQCNPEGCDAKK